jgi:stalled ribosome rescue protein Dom34
MVACVLWIDSEHAKVSKISAQGIDKKTLKHHESHPIGRHHDEHKHNAETHFFHEIINEIGKVEELLVFGAGVTKNHFKNHIESHNHGDLSKSLVGVETLDHLTDNQILEASRAYFKKNKSFIV